MPEKPKIDQAFLNDLLHNLGYLPNDLSPVLARVVMQWLEVLPAKQVASALQVALASPEPLHTFRQSVQLFMHPIKECLTTPKKVVSHCSSPPDYLSALAAQDRLEAMSDSEYLEELLRRRRLR